MYKTIQKIRRLPILQFTIFILQLLLLACSCEKSTTDPPPPEPGPKAELTLKLLDVSLSETWLRFGIDKVELPQAFSITRDGAVVFADSLYTPDTLLYDSSLAFGSSYTYRAYRLVEGQKSDSSAILQISTLDTTSHNFTWEILTFGDGSSVLRDVAIVNESDIWAVGEINTLDSTGNWVNPPYNAVHWDGQQWELKRIPTNSAVGIGYYPINTVFAFGADNVWMFSDAGSYCHWNGTNWQTQYVPERQGGINKIWGSSPNDMYFVGTNGNITHYNGSNWQKLESGTDLPIQDIWGAVDPLSGEQIILCVASNIYQNDGKALLRIESNQVYPLPDEGLSWSLSSVWFVPNWRYWIAGAGIYQKDSLQSQGQWVRYSPGQVTSYFTNRIRGRDMNDIVAVGAFGEIVHFNGLTWRNYYQQTQLNSGSYFGVDLNGELIVAAGQANARGVIAIGYR